MTGGGGWTTVTCGIDGATHVAGWTKVMGGHVGRTVVLETIDDEDIGGRRSRDVEADSSSSSSRSRFLHSSTTRSRVSMRAMETRGAHFVFKCFVITVVRGSATVVFQYSLISSRSSIFVRSPSKAILCDESNCKRWKIKIYH